MDEFDKIVSQIDVGKDAQRAAARMREMEKRKQAEKLKRQKPVKPKVGPWQRIVNWAEARATTQNRTWK